VNGTPTFFINGVRDNGPADAASLLAALELHADHGVAVNRR
jgi:protein-disulfide isomerase